MLAGEHEVILDKSPDPEETSEEKAILKKIKRTYQISKRARQIYDKDWTYNYEFVFGGRQYPAFRPDWRFNDSINMTWQGIMQEVGIQTDSRMKTEFNAEEPSDVEFSEILKQINDRNWEKYHWFEQVAAKVLEAKIVHVTHVESRWNPKANNGLGEVEHHSLDPMYCWWDPQATGVHDLRWFHYAKPIPTSEVKRMYPKEQIKPDINKLGSIYGGITSPDRDVFLDASGYGATGREENADGDEPMTLLVRTWIKDEELEDVEEENEKGEKETVTRKKYPNGRYIEWIGSKVLRDTVPGVEIDGEWVPYEHQGFPIARLVNYNYPNRYAGENEVTHLRGPQKLLNYLVGSAVDAFKKSNNPKTIITHSATELAEEITDEPGIVLEVANQNDIRFEPGQGIPASTFNLIELAKGFVDLVRGTGEVSRGAVPANVSSGVFFESLLESEQIRPRLKARATQAFLRELGQIDLSHYLQFYTAERVFQITNKDGAKYFVGFSVARDDHGGKVANIREFDEDGKQLPTGVDAQERPIMTPKKLPLKGEMDVRVSIGSALPFAKAVKNDKAERWLQLGAIDLEAFYEMVDLPNKENVLKRMKEQAAAAAQQGG